MFACLDQESPDQRPPRRPVFEDDGIGSMPVGAEPEEQEQERVRLRDRTSDDFFKQCYNTKCGMPFSFTRRRHHCRRCGFVFCHECSSKELAGNLLPGKKIYDDNVPQRVCDSCFEYAIQAEKKITEEASSERIDSFVSMSQSFNQHVGQSSALQRGPGDLLDSSMSLSPACTPTRMSQSVRPFDAELEWNPWNEDCTERVNAYARIEASRLGLSEDWAPELAKLSVNSYMTVADHIAFYGSDSVSRSRPTHGGSVMNVLNFVRIMTIAHPGEHDIYSGLVLRQNVPDRSMRKQLRNPRILVCAESIQFRQDDVLEMDLHKQLEAEQNYAKNAAKKICAMKPDVVVTKEATRLLLEEMISAEVVVVNSLTEAQILRISHATGATPITMTQMGATSDSEQLMGTCDRFEVKTYREGHRLGKSSTPSTYCFFVGCQPSKISSVVLRGKPLPELLKAKVAMKSMLRMVHDLALEASLLANKTWPLKVHHRPLAIGVSNSRNMNNSVTKFGASLTNQRLRPPSLRFKFASYCSSDCQEKQHKKIAWQDVMINFYNNDSIGPDGKEVPELQCVHETSQNDSNLIKVRDMTLAAWIVECYTSAKAVRRLESCGAENCMQRDAGIGSNDTRDHSYKIIRVMNHVVTFAVKKHHDRSNTMNHVATFEDIKIMGSCGCMENEQLRLMDASRSISFGKFLSLVFSDDKLLCEECGKHLFRGHHMIFEYQDAQIILKYEDLPGCTLSDVNPTYFPGAPEWAPEPQTFAQTEGMMAYEAAAGEDEKMICGAEAESCVSSELEPEPAIVRLRSPSSPVVSSTAHQASPVLQSNREPQFPPMPDDDDFRSQSVPVPTLSTVLPPIPAVDLSQNEASVDALLEEEIVEGIRSESQASVTTQDRGSVNVAGKILSDTFPLCQTIASALMHAQHVEHVGKHSISSLGKAPKLSISTPSSQLSMTMSEGMVKPGDTLLSNAAMAENQDEEQPLSHSMPSNERCLASISSPQEHRIEVRLEDADVEIYMPSYFYELRGKELGNHQRVNEVIFEAQTHVTSDEQCGSGGKKGSFHMTADKKLFVKEITKNEHHIFELKMEKFAEHNKKNKPSVFSKILGLYRIKTTNRKGGFSSGHVFYTILMQNCIPPGPSYRQFDLKGCTYGRKKEPEAATGFEEDLFEFTKGYPLFIVNDCYKYLREAILRDSSLLRDMQGLNEFPHHFSCVYGSVGQVMDYSLLLGINQADSEILVRVIDYGRQYGMVESVERVLRQGRTVTKPDDYMRRLDVFCRNLLEPYDESGFCHSDSITDWAVTEAAALVVDAQDENIGEYRIANIDQLAKEICSESQPSPPE